MGVKYLLDTSVYSQVLKRMPAPEVVRRWKAAGDAACCISVFCELEVLQGLEMAASARLHELYKATLKDRIELLPFTRAEALVFATLQAHSVRAGTTRPVIDLCIAATAITHGCTLATLNIKDFSGFPSLIVEDWGVGGGPL